MPVGFNHTKTISFIGIQGAIWAHSLLIFVEKYLPYPHIFKKEGELNKNRLEKKERKRENVCIYVINNDKMKICYASVYR